jgi:hypothetical protein
MDGFTSDEGYESDESSEEWSFSASSICRDEADFLEGDKPSHRYYLGYISRMDDVDYFLDTAIRPATFLKYAYESAVEYLNRFSLVWSNRTIEIMYMTHGPFQSYDVVAKTHWLRLVQRTWKRVYAERKREIQTCLWESPYNIRMTEFPSIRGMLASVKKQEIHT